MTILALLLLAGQAGPELPAPGKPEPAEAAAPTWDLSFEIAGVTDYRFRGVSLSGQGRAAQGGVDLAHGSGLYGGAWASNIAETAGGADVEVDLSVGYAAEFGGVSLDAALLYYLYPGDGAADYGEAIFTAARPLGPVTPTLGVAYAPAQDALRGENGRTRDNLYLFGTAELPLAGTPLALTGGAGWETGAFDLSERGGKWDWQAGLTADFELVTLGLSYVDSDASAPDARGRNLAGAGLVLSATLGF